ncbi:MAG: hypothetical protein H6Q89_5703, partial [Myxococcaceae bacterium]|nr:hypothetical protein [Myxococcaceae bacterium]
MIIRPSAVFAAALALLLCGCPPKSATDGGTNPDGGDGGPNVLPEEKCSGGCSINQKCDPVRRICVDGCGGCDAGVCVKNATTMAFECAPVVTSCQ